MDDEAIEKLAREEILSEAKRGAARAEIIGPTGWEICPVPETNKTFLQNTLFNVVGANNIKNRKRDKLAQSSDDDEYYKSKRHNRHYETKSDRKKSESKEKIKTKHAKTSEKSTKKRHE